MSNSFEALKPKYTDLLSRYKTKASWKVAANSKAKKILAFKDRYQEVALELNMPWEFIGVVHSLEGNLNFNTHLHNGNSLSRRTKDVPAGRPEADPEDGEFPYSWRESALDALRLKGLQNVEEWSDERLCYEFERYNGFGYRNNHPKTLSPYIWSGSNLYTSGKYVADGVWSNAAVSKQIGAWLLISELRLLQEKEEVKEVVANSSKIQTIDNTNNTIIGGTLFSAIVYYLGVAKEYFLQLKTFVSENAAIVIVSILIIVVLINKLLKSKIIKDYKDGRYTPSGMSK